MLKPGTTAYRAAFALACGVLPLVFAGAGVTSKDAGMAFPDWPTSSGHLINPPGWWRTDSTLWEHGHRLLGWAVGILAIVATFACWRRGLLLRSLSIATLIAIGVQGLLGGLRVREVSTELAMIHGIWGQACFCLTFSLALLTSPGWAMSKSTLPEPASHFFRRGCLVGLLCAILQLVSGATYRHLGHSYALAAHLVGAIVVILVLSWLAMWTLERYPSTPLLGTLGKALAALIGLQMLLGGLAFLVVVMGGDWPATLRWAAPSAHVVVGAMLLACVLALTLSAYHVLVPAASAVDSTQALPGAAL